MTVCALNGQLGDFMLTGKLNMLVRTTEDRESARVKPLLYHAPLWWAAVKLKTFAHDAWISG